MLGFNLQIEINNVHEKLNSITILYGEKKCFITPFEYNNNVLKARKRINISSKINKRSNELNTLHVWLNDLCSVLKSINSVKIKNHFKETYFVYIF